jgi:predicted GIY-YIG superfamily endonuclease
VARSKRNYYRYELRERRRIVYIGITNNPKRREDEHKSEGKRFTRMGIVGPAVTQASAEKWEAKRLEQYRRTHGGKNPRYNQAET